MKKGFIMLMAVALLGGTAVYAETGTSTASTTPDKVCAQVITWAKNAAGKIEQFPNACIPAGWTVIYKEDGKKVERIENSVKKRIEKVESDLAKQIESKPMLLEVGPKGKAFIRGKIQSISTNSGSSNASSTGSIVVKTWGGNWTVVVYADTELVPQGAFSQFKVGDYVGVRGQIDPDATLTVGATVLRNWSQQATQTIQSLEEKKKEDLKKLEEQKKKALGQ